MGSLRAGPQESLPEAANPSAASRLLGKAEGRTSYQTTVATWHTERFRTRDHRSSPLASRTGRPIASCRSCRYRPASEATRSLNHGSWLAGIHPVFIFDYNSDATSPESTAARVAHASGGAKSRNRLSEIL